MKTNFSTIGVDSVSAFNIPVCCPANLLNNTSIHLLMSSMPYGIRQHLQYISPGQYISPSYNVFCRSGWNLTTLEIPKKADPTFVQILQQNRTSFPCQDRFKNVGIKSFHLLSPNIILLHDFFEASQRQKQFCYSLKNLFRSFSFLCRTLGYSGPLISLYLINLHVDEKMIHHHMLDPRSRYYDKTILKVDSYLMCFLHDIGGLVPQGRLLYYVHIQSFCSINVANWYPDTISSLSMFLCWIWTIRPSGPELDSGTRGPAPHWKYFIHRTVVHCRALNSKIFLKYRAHKHYQNTNCSIFLKLASVLTHVFAKPFSTTRSHLITI